jgi:uracil-DNA glycosylase
MSEQLEQPKKPIEKTQEAAAELQEEDLEEAHKNSVPIISDKEIEAIFVGGVPGEADESKRVLRQRFCRRTSRSTAQSKR